MAHDKLDQVEKIADNISGKEMLHRHLVESLAKTCCALICQVPSENTAVARIVVTTPKLRQLFGYVDGELEGEDIKLLIPKRFHAKHEQHVLNFFKHPVPRQMGAMGMELIGVKKDGTEFSVEVSLDSEYIEHAGNKDLYITAHVMAMARQ